MRFKAALGFIVAVWLIPYLGLGQTDDGTPPSAETSRPERIVSLSPNLTEIVYGVGAFDRVVAVSRYCEFPPEVSALPRVGGWTNTNLEQLMSLAPDLVLLTQAQAPIVGDKLTALDIRWAGIEAQSMSDIYQAIRSIGELVGNLGEGEALAHEVETAIRGFTRVTEGAGKPRVLIVVDRLPGTLRDMYVATEGSFLVDLVRAVGGEPLTPASRHQYAQIGSEALVALDPEVVFDVVQAVSESVTLANAGSQLREDPMAVWQEVSTVSAVRNNRVYLVDDRTAVHPSQFVVKTGERLLGLLHPELVSELGNEAIRSPR